MNQNPVFAQTELAPDYSWQQIRTRVMEAVLEMADVASRYLPTVILALILLIVGLILAKLIAAIIGKSAQRIGIQSGCDKLGITDLLARVGIQTPVPRILKGIIYWLLVLAVLKVVVATLNVRELSQALSTVIGFLPQAFMAAVILVAGLLVADWGVQNAEFGSRSFPAGIRQSKAPGLSASRIKLDKEAGIGDC